MVCFLLVVCDVWAGFRRRKHWFPCRFFTINSVTLTLISIATKIPVDLTTTMPSAPDQLSKLFGTVFICVAMSFMLPSVATNAEFESYAIVISLTIFVITVMVNICIQLSTGVIFSFIPEHKVILVCMLFLLIRFWSSVIDLNALKSDYADQSVDLIREGDGSMLSRLKLCYMYSYHCCPQLYASRVFYLGDVAVVCVTCSVVLLQGAFRSKDVSFCGGSSDYGWSMWLVVGSQSLTIAVATIAIRGRCLAYFDANMNVIKILGEEDPYLQFQYLFSLRKIPKFAEKCFRFVIFLPLFIFNLVFGVLSWFVELGFWKVLVLCRVLPKEHTSVVDISVFKDLLETYNVVVENWLVGKGVEDMERWVEINRQASPKHVTKLLSDVPPSRELVYRIGLNGHGISSLHLILLVEMNKLVKPPNSHERIPLRNILDEVFEIIYFIDERINVSSSTSRMELMMASVIHQYALISGLGEFVLIQKADFRHHMHNFRVGPETVWSPSFGRWMANGSSSCLLEATNRINSCISYFSGASSEVVSGRIIEQLFINMLVTFLSQLPAAIYKHILDSPVEEYEERVRLGLGYICKLESLKSHMSFALPPEGNITDLFETQTSPTNMQSQGGQGIIGPTPVAEVGEIQDGAQVP